MATPIALISKRLRPPSMAARFPLRTLCTSPQSPLRSHSPPLRLLGHRQDDEGDHTIFNFFSISYGPELRPLEGHHDLALGKVCLGSSHGWLALSHNHKTLSLWNPLTDSQIQLPSYHLDAEDFPYRKLILSSDPAAAGEDCIALTTHGIPVGDKKVAICRLGDDAWTPLPCPPGFGGSKADRVYYDGRFYVAAYAKVWVVDVGQNPGLELLPVHFDEKPSLEEIDASCLVESEGDLLLVLVYYGSDPEDMSMYKFRYQFELFKVEWGMEKAKLVKMESLAGRSLFLGRNHSFSVLASQHSACQGNCIYLEDYLWIGHQQTKIRVTSLEDGSNILILNRSLWNPNCSEWKPCAWIPPSMSIQAPGTS